jgi:hypothetical protein
MKLLWLLIVLVLPLTACERATIVRLEGGNPPSFALSGSGRLEQLIIFGPKQRDADSPLNNALWLLKPEHPASGARFLEDMHVIEYGVVPKGYMQEYPVNNAPPPSLVPGVKYRYLFITSGAPIAQHYFEIIEGKPVELPDEAPFSQ